MLSFMPEVLEFRHDLTVDNSKDIATGLKVPGVSTLNSITRIPLTLPLSIKIAQNPHVIGSFGAKALKYESFEGKGIIASTRRGVSSPFIEPFKGTLKGQNIIVPQTRSYLLKIRAEALASFSRRSDSPSFRKPEIAGAYSQDHWT